MMNGPPAANEQEKAIKVIVMQAKDEDALVEKTGVEADDFNY